MILNLICLKYVKKISTDHKCQFLTVLPSIVYYTFMRVEIKILHEKMNMYYIFSKICSLFFWQNRNIIYLLYQVDIFQSSYILLPTIFHMCYALAVHRTSRHRHLYNQRIGHTQVDVVYTVQDHNGTCLHCKYLVTIQNEQLG